MIEQLLDIFYISLFCMGWHTVTSDGMLLSSLRSLGDRIFHEKSFFSWVYMPVFGCPICYASFWGSIVYWILNAPCGKAFILWIPTLFCVAFVNKIWLLITEK
jgi:hypothetical protein